MGPSTCIHMLFGAVLGWGILSPLAKARGWAPGPVSDWENGSKGWIAWVSLAIMLADSITSLTWLVIRLLLVYGSALKARVHGSRLGKWMSLKQNHSYINYSALNNTMPGSTGHEPHHGAAHDEEEDDAPPSELISPRTVAVLLPLTLILNVVCMHIAFRDAISPLLSSVATLLAVLLSIMGVRALGETDLNPVSGISKLTQLLFSIATPSSHFSRRSAVVTNLLAGAVSEAGALQAGDMMQDLKTGHLMGASPKAQFYGQIIGSLAGAVLSTVVYKLYVSVYDVPGPIFQTPTAYLWIFTARLVTGQGLPRMAWTASWIAGSIFVASTILRTIAVSPLANGGKRGVSAPWRQYIPGGIAVAVGMFNVPSFTLARAVGGLIAWCWNWKILADNKKKKDKNMAAAAAFGASDGPLLFGHNASEGDLHLDANFDLSASADESMAHDSMDDEGGIREESGRRPQVDGDQQEQQQQRRDGEADAGDASDSSTVIVLASGLVLGEGTLSIVNLLLASSGMPHF